MSGAELGYNRLVYGAFTMTVTPPPKQVKATANDIVKALDRINNSIWWIFWIVIGLSILGAILANGPY